jgi:hypothetical protein
MSIYTIESLILNEKQHFSARIFMIGINRSCAEAQWTLLKIKGSKTKQRVLATAYRGRVIRDAHTAQ